MKRFDAAHPMWNRILGVLYAPLVLFCFLGHMAGERAIGETNLLIVAACDILAYGLPIIALTTHPALIRSGKCFETGKRVAGHLLRWYPVLAVPVLACIAELLFFLAEL